MQIIIKWCFKNDHIDFLWCVQKHTLERFCTLQFCRVSKFGIERFIVIQKGNFHYRFYHALYVMPSLSNHSFRKPKLFTLLDHLRQRYSTHLQTRMPQQLCHCLFLRIWMFLKKVLNRKQSFRVMKNKLVILFERTAIKLKLMTYIIRLPIVNTKYISKVIRNF